jgi:hypothetical protein
MTRDEIVAAIARRIGRRTDMDAEILLEMDLAQSTYLERNGRIVPWFLPLTLGSLPTVANQEYVALPAGYVGVPEHGGYFLQNEDGDWIKMTKGDYDRNLDRFQDETEFPQRYAISDARLYLRPIPDAIYTGRLVYKAVDALPSDTAADAENLWMTHAADCLIYQTAIICARDILHDFDLAAIFEGPLKAAFDRLHVETERREHEDREYHMGDS